MKFNQIVLISIALFMFPTIIWAACKGSSPVWNATPDRASVAECVSQAKAGDTIKVGAGSSTWSNAITVNKGIKIIGAGIGNTVIKKGGKRLFQIDNPSNSHLLRISGFTFKVGNGAEGGGIDMTCSDKYPKFNIRIDNNLFTTPSGTCSTGHCFIRNGGCRGVIDSNTFEKAEYPFGVGLAGDFPGKTAWINLPELVYGAANDNIYVEDNIIKNISEAGAVTDCDEGGRYVFRYNNIIPDSDMYPFFDAHGGKSGVYGCMGVELYGNYYDGAGRIYHTQDGARAIVHHNYASDRGSIQITDGEGCPQLQKEHLNNNYYALNRDGSLSGSLIGVRGDGTITCGITIDKDEDFWSDNLNCIAPNTCENISSGIGCGTLSNRPAKCKPGTAYWATNQSCTDLTGMVGKNPSTPISGILYRCTSEDTWTAYYEPYSYPHPLRY